MNENLKIIKTVFMPGKKKGKKVYGEQEGKRGKRENLVAGRRKSDSLMTRAPEFYFRRRTTPPTLLSASLLCLCFTLCNFENATSQKYLFPLSSQHSRISLPRHHLMD